MTNETPAPPAAYGLMAEFTREDELLAAARRIYAGGYRRLDAFSPFPVEGLAETLGRPPTKLPLVVLAGGILGGLGGYFMLAYSAVFDYPLNVGGRPLHSWPAFIPITFELTILGATLAAVFGMIALNGLPRPYHPVFNVPQFEAASRSGFFLLVIAEDAQYDPEQTRRDLEAMKPVAVHEVPR